eukprot:6208444-Pyramimonas_sp.AAC.1
MCVNSTMCEYDKETIVPCAPGEGKRGNPPPEGCCHSMLCLSESSGEGQEGVRRGSGEGRVLSQAHRYVAKVQEALAEYR